MSKRALSLGDVIGWQTLSLSASHTSKLGYPCNLDSSQNLQDATRGALRDVVPNNVEYGPDALGGVSRGPWVQNLQVLQARTACSA